MRVDVFKLTRKGKLCSWGKDRLFRALASIAEAMPAANPRDPARPVFNAFLRVNLWELISVWLFDYL